jgi:hypothetical protein
LVREESRVKNNTTPSPTTPPHSIPWPARRHPLVHLVLSFDIDWPRLHPGHTNSTIVLSYRSSCDLQSAKKSSREGFVPANPSSHTATTFPSVPPSGPSKTPLRCCFSRSVTLDLSLSRFLTRRAFSQRALLLGRRRGFFHSKFNFRQQGPLNPFLSPFPFPLVSLSKVCMSFPLAQTTRNLLTTTTTRTTQRHLFTTLSRPLSLVRASSKASSSPCIQRCSCLHTGPVSLLAAKKKKMREYHPCPPSFSLVIMLGFLPG